MSKRLVRCIDDYIPYPSVGKLVIGQVYELLREFVDVDGSISYIIALASGYDGEMWVSANNFILVPKGLLVMKSEGLSKEEIAKFRKAWYSGIKTEERKCNCDLGDLMIHGCKCGGE